MLELVVPVNKIVMTVFSIRISEFFPTDNSFTFMANCLSICQELFEHVLRLMCRKGCDAGFHHLPLS